jgi:hypothetical protein
MEDRVLEEYLKSSRQLRQKYEEIKHGKLKRYTTQEEKYKPLLSPVQNYGSHLGSQTEILKEMNSKMFSSTPDGEVGELALKYILNPQGQVDKLYGIYRDDDGLYIGNKRISVFNNDIFLEDDKTTYRGTPGLWELVTMDYPNPSLYNNEDLENYSDIVLKTSTYKAGNKASARRIKTSEGYKYTNIILPILYKHNIKQPPLQSTPTKKKEGKGLQKIVTNAFPEYIYYKNIDELLERLYILYGELKAGNTHPSLKNEIIEIISEFKKF